MRVTYELLASKRGLAPSEAVLRTITKCSETVVNECPKLIDGAIDLLAWASQHFQLCLLTRGIRKLQMRKTAQTGISKYFNKIDVVLQKDAQAVTRLIKEQGFAPGSSWVIGDSIKSDINPGIEAGATCILYLYSHPEYQWVQEYGVKPMGSFYLAKMLLEIRQILESPGDFTLVSEI